ncbi:caspase family protein [Microbacterium yannicii]|uniref:Caspase family protein n=1 Tax=Microbacterium yannicii TaxID=671622 RepID=A0ABP9M336_9MICO|nr:caspase family protein [Microbacterium yannicii]MCO5954548.1 caspase family protein [Microbacterium yannicii]
MASGLSLHIGLNRVDPAHYDGWDGALNACEFDALDMQAIAESCGFDTNLLLTQDATADAVKAAISRAADELAPGDLFFLSYSGHGGQVPDGNGDDEVDHLDETWVAFDRQLVDDELYALWATFAPGARIVVLSDSCHSGTANRRIGDEAEVPNVVKTRQQAAAASPRYRAMPQDVLAATYRAHAELYDDIQKQVPSAGQAQPEATVLLISGCRDDQLSRDGLANGLFTENLKAVWNDGAWEGGYPAFRETIRARMPQDQQPNYNPVGAGNPEFEQQKPFSIG